MGFEVNVNGEQRIFIGIDEIKKMEVNQVRDVSQEGDVIEHTKITIQTKESAPKAPTPKKEEAITT